MKRTLYRKALYAAAFTAAPIVGLSAASADENHDAGVTERQAELATPPSSERAGYGERDVIENGSLAESIESAEGETSSANAEANRKEKAQRFDAPASERAGYGQMDPVDTNNQAKRSSTAESSTDKMMQVNGRIVDAASFYGKSDVVAGQAGHVLITNDGQAHLLLPAQQVELHDHSEKMKSTGQDNSDLPLASYRNDRESPAAYPTPGSGFDDDMIVAAGADEGTAKAQENESTADADQTVMRQIEAEAFLTDYAGLSEVTLFGHAVDQAGLKAFIVKSAVADDSVALRAAE
ncbi:MAG: hypothetical protein AAF710_04050 [Planctomycetota bacterium]